MPFTLSKQSGLTHSVSASRARLENTIACGRLMAAAVPIVYTAILDAVVFRLLLKASATTVAEQKVKVQPSHLAAAKTRDAELAAVLPGIWFVPEARVITAAAVQAERVKRAAKLGVALDELDAATARLAREHAAKAKGLSLEDYNADCLKRSAGLRAFNEKKKAAKLEA